MDAGAYCRQVEAHLCQRNGGHLIRIVGPAFELVGSWSAGGVPLSVVRRAVDRVCARRRAQGRTRRPVRIEHCAAEVLDLFDDWRRAVGTGRPAAPEPAAGEEAAHKPRRGASGGGAARRRPALAAHVERAAARLAAWRGAGPETELGRAVAGAAAELGAASGGAVLRGKARQALVDRLAALDRALLAAARETAGDTQGRLRDDAAEELAPYRARMESEAFRRAVEAGVDRLLVERFDLPRLTWD